MALFDIFKKKKNKKEEKKTTDAKNTRVEVTEEVKDIKTEAPTVKSKIEKDVKPQDNSPAIEKKEDTTKSAKAEEKTVKNEPKPEAKSSEKQKAKPAPKAETKTEETYNKNVAIKPEQKNKAKAEEKNEATTDSKGYTGRFEINKSKDGKKFFFNLYASNKVGIATSQMYSSAQSALVGIKSVIANAADAPIEDQTLKKYEPLPFPKWEIYIDNGGKYRFRLNASNGSCVCHSQGYTTKTACKNGIDSIIRSSRNAEIDKTYINNKD